MKIEIRPYTTTCAEALAELQRKYIAANPKGTKFVPLSYYENDPENVLCAFSEGGCLTGYGVLHPSPADPGSPTAIPNTIWTYIRIDPQSGNQDAVQDQLFEAVFDRANLVCSIWGDRKTRLAASYPGARVGEIAFFESKGFNHYEVLLQMGRDLSQPLPQARLPEGITVRKWAMDSREAKEKYLRVENKMFPESPRDMRSLQTLIDSWQGGTPVIAFDRDDEIAGSMMAFWFGGGFGITEEVFVVPAWRRKGIAKFLLVEGMKVLIETNLQWAGLEVKESNLAAVNLYQSLGYQESNREVQMGLWI